MNTISSLTVQLLPSDLSNIRSSRSVPQSNTARRWHLIIGLLLIALSYSFNADAQNPPSGTYFSMQMTNLPPMPFDPLPDLNIYADPSGPAGTYFYDDRSLDYTSDATTTSTSQFGLTSADEPAPPGDGGGSTNPLVREITMTRPSNGYTPCVTWTNFWLIVSNDSSGVTVTISNTLAGLQYVLLQKQSLNDPSWTTVQTLTATGPVTQCSTISPGTNTTQFFEAKLTNYLAPVLIAPPTNVVVAAGSSASFHVVADASPGAGYQWYFNGTAMSGATASEYSISSAHASDVGLYTIVVSNAICTASASAYLGLSWSRYLTNAISASPAVNPIDGTIYVATLSDQLVALNVADGHPKWVASVPNSDIGELTSSPAVATDGSAIYVGSTDGSVYAISTNGTLLWSANLGAAVVSSPAVGSDGTVYVPTSDATLFSLNPTNGAINWSFVPDDTNPFGRNSSDSSCAIGSDCNIYFATQIGQLYAVHPDGSLAWFFPLPTGSIPTGSPAIDADGNILIGSSDGYLYCVGSDGGLRWLFNTTDGSEISSSPAVGADGTVYAASKEGGTIYAITNGNVKWEFTATNMSGSPLPFVSSPAVTSLDVVFAGNADSAGGLYGVADGAEVTLHSTAAAIYASPAIDPADGGIIIADMAGYVYKLPGIGDFPVTAPWPMFRRSADHAAAMTNSGCNSPAAVAFPNNPVLQRSSGTFSFNLSGTPNSRWEIYASTNLTNWIALGAVTLDSYSGFAGFSDSGVAGLTNRFYKAHSSTGCSQIFGFIIQTLDPHTTNLIANPFYQVNDATHPQNTAQGLTTMMNQGGFDELPDDVQIGKWNGMGFDSVEWDTGQQKWMPNGDMTLLPGKSFFVTNNSDNTITIPFTGNIAPGTATNYIIPGAVFISSFLPQAGKLQTDLGFIPNDGDQVLLWNTNHYLTNTYYTATGWSPSEPSLQIGQGLLLVTSYSNNWLSDPLDCSNILAVTANPLWTDSGLIVSSNDTIVFHATGTWTGNVVGSSVGPEGNGLTNAEDFVAGPVQYGLIAFVGPNPYLDSSGADRWGDSSYFPQLSVTDGGTTGYWFVGTNGVFTTDRSGKLWFGFNDDAVGEVVYDNRGAVSGVVQIIHHP